VRKRGEKILKWAFFKKSHFLQKKPLNTQKAPPSGFFVFVGVKWEVNEESVWASYVSHRFIIKVINLINQSNKFIYNQYQRSYILLISCLASQCNCMPLSILRWRCDNYIVIFMLC